MYKPAFWAISVSALVGGLACSGGSGDGSATGGNGSSTGGMPGAAGGIAETGPMLEGITAAHNVVRANVQPPASAPIPDLVWDPALAAVAQRIG